MFTVVCGVVCMPEDPSQPESIIISILLYTITCVL